MFGRKAARMEDCVSYLEEMLALQLELNTELVARLDQFERRQDQLANDLRAHRHAAKS